MKGGSAPELRYTELSNNNSVTLKPMTSLNDYLRAERPDRTEPVTFYRPGATSWSDMKALRVPVTGGPDEDELTDPFDNPEDDDIANEVAAAQTAATLSKLEE